MDLTRKANQIRRDVIENAVLHKKGHIAPSLSTVDILVALFYDVLRIDDFVVLSKGHGCYALYSILADKKLMIEAWWTEWKLPGCLERQPLSPYMPFSTGSLGHGLPQAVGLAWARKRQGLPGNVWCIVGDGEMQEGSMWEAIMMAVRHELDNLTIIVDENRLQAMEQTLGVIDLNSPGLNPRLRGFGLEVAHYSDGHNLHIVTKALEDARSTLTAVLFRTIKGKGLYCAENTSKWHYRVPTEKEYVPQTRNRV